MTWHLLILVVLCAALGWSARHGCTISVEEEQVLGWMPHDVTTVSIVRPDFIPVNPYAGFEDEPALHPQANFLACMTCPFLPLTTSCKPTLVASGSRMAAGHGVVCCIALGVKQMPHEGDDSTPVTSFPWRTVEPDIVVISNDSATVDLVVSRIKADAGDGMPRVYTPPASDSAYAWLASPQGAFVLEPDDKLASIMHGRGTHEFVDAVRRFHGNRAFVSPDGRQVNVVLPYDPHTTSMQAELVGALMGAASPP